LVDVRVRRGVQLPRRLFESERVVKRNVQPELLDSLPSGDPRAIRSRRDLRRVNRWMRNPAVMAAALQQALNGCAPAQITELGAGDGDFLLRVAQRLDWSGVPSRARANRPAAGQRTETMRANLLDRKNEVSAETLAAFAAVRWRAETVTADVFEWPPAASPSGVVIANLFLHHFAGSRLVELLRLISQRAELFIAIEPRRASWPLFCSRLLWGVGCNAVTCHDAVVSVRAGFSGDELSELWPDKPDWLLTEHRAGGFSHLFMAQKAD
jgi:hypothetical protein